MLNSVMSVVIFVVGKGICMYFDFFKVLYILVGKLMVQYVIDVVNDLGVCVVYLVYGYGGDLLCQILYEDNLNWVLQVEQFGIGYVMQQVVLFFNDDEDILMFYGDVLLIFVEMLQCLCVVKLQGGIGLLMVKLDDLIGYGCIICENGQVMGIVEYKDVSEVQCQIQEINIGILIVGGVDLKCWLVKFINNNVQGEYYIIDIIVMVYQEGYQIVVVYLQCLSEVEGVNNCLQFVCLECVYQVEQVEKLLLVGVMLCDLVCFDLCGMLQYGCDVEIDINVILEGNVVLGD